MEAGAPEQGLQPKHPKLEPGTEQPTGPQPQPSGDTDASGAAAAAAVTSVGRECALPSAGSRICARPRPLSQHVAWPCHSPSITRLVPSPSQS